MQIIKFISLQFFNIHNLQQIPGNSFNFYKLQDQQDYVKADPDAYLQIADKLDLAGFDHISIEDAHRHNDLELFKRFKKSKVNPTVIQLI